MHVKEGYFFTSPKRVTSPTWGPPPPCKQALKYEKKPNDEDGSTSFIVRRWDIGIFGARLIVSRCISFCVQPLPGCHCSNTSESTLARIRGLLRSSGSSEILKEVF